MSKTLDHHGEMRFHLLIPAAGSASRMGMDTPKQFVKIGNKAILRHTIEKFININGLQSVLIVINKECTELYNDAVSGLQNVSRETGSNSRKKSVYNGLQYFSKADQDDIILIHDAARPMLQEQDILKLLSVMQTADAATLATPVSDTLYREGETISRDGLWAIQTPQAFRIGALIAAHEKFKDDDSFTDDAGIMRAAGHKVEIVEGCRSNIKITTQDDLKMAQRMMTDEAETRTTNGFDVHAFEKNSSERKLMLGGIHIPHAVALNGHSDADVVLHAVTDALLGSINAGDIGTHFPPSDMQWKDKDSAFFLQEAAKMLADKDAEIKFIDVTIMAEEPKIGPHRSAIQSRIADILGITPARISIKATTTEGLGFTGRKEGIACQALATVTLPIL